MAGPKGRHRLCLLARAQYVAAIEPPSMFVYPTSKGSRLIVVFWRARRRPLRQGIHSFPELPASFQTPLANLNASLQGEGEVGTQVDPYGIDITFAFGVFGGGFRCLWCPRSDRSNANRLCGVEMNFDHFCFPAISPRFV